jgi:NADH:ubiquinone reductase (H+-translocating)
MLRAGVIALLETASVEPDAGRRKRMLTFVVAGGGFAGVETIGAINDLAPESSTLRPIGPARGCRQSPGKFP